MHLADIIITILSFSQIDDSIKSITIQKLYNLLGREAEKGDHFRMRFFTFMPFLYKIDPDLVIKEVLPYFKLGEPKAIDYWKVQQYNLGEFSPELFKLIEKPFIEIIEQEKLNDEELEFFVRQLVKMLILNQLGHLDLEITLKKTRSILKKLGKKCLPFVATELSSSLAEVDKKFRSRSWNQIIRPVLKGIWPLDVKLQTTQANDSLIEVICLSDSAILDSFMTIFPIMKFDKMQSKPSIDLLTNLESKIVKSAPEAIIDLLLNVIGERPTSRQLELKKLLAQISKGNSRIENSKKFQFLSKLVNEIPNLS